MSCAAALLIFLSLAIAGSGYTAKSALIAAVVVYAGKIQGLPKLHRKYIDHKRVQAMEIWAAVAKLHHVK